MVLPGKVRNWGLFFKMTFLRLQLPDLKIAQPPDYLSHKAGHQFVIDASPCVCLHCCLVYCISSFGTVIKASAILALLCPLVTKGVFISSPGQQNKPADTQSSQRQLRCHLFYLWLPPSQIATIIPLQFGVLAVCHSKARCNFPKALHGKVLFRLRSGCAQSFLARSASLALSSGSSKEEVWGTGQKPVTILFLFENHVSVSSGGSLQCLPSMKDNEKTRALSQEKDGFVTFCCPREQQRMLCCDQDSKGKPQIAQLWSFLLIFHMN